MKTASVEAKSVHPALFSRTAKRPADTDVLSTKATPTIRTLLSKTKETGRKMRRMRLQPELRWAACLVAVGLFSSAHADVSLDNATFEKDVAPLVKKYCLKCHAGAKPEAEFSLEGYKNEADVTSKRVVWTKVADFVGAQQMPPEDQPQPTSAERQLLVMWIRDRFKKIDCTGKPNPGRVTMRRLNRAEYNNTIRDLFGVDLRPADEFPTDDTGYGFDNIGDVLTMSPILMEKYLSASERLVEAVFTGNFATGKSAEQRFSARDLKGGEMPDRKGRSRALTSNGEMYIVFSVRQPGEFLIRARAYQTPGGNESAKMGIQVDGKEIKTFEVKALENQPASFEVRTRLNLGDRKIGVTFLNDFYDANEKDPKKKDRNLFVQGIAIQPTVQSVEPYKRLMLVEPKNKSEYSEAARKNLRSLARRAFRRPVSKEEIDRLVAYVDRSVQAGDGFENGMKLAVQAILISPHFLFRVEADPVDTQERLKANKSSFLISEFELASRLSYFLWSSMPDDELFEAADAGELRDVELFEKQVRRMLADPKSKAFVENFGGQWLETRKLASFQPDPRQFRGFSSELREAMQKETELVFEHILSNDRSILEFLEADYTFLNERLARHYGFTDVKGPEFRQVKLKTDQRGGLLTQATFLSITSNPTRTSPVKRGKWILENLLGTPPPPAPPNVPELSEEKKGPLSGTLRQRMEQHRKNPNCASCHQRMDPLGFGFENFDAIGAYRTMDGFQKIDPSGKLPSGEKFAGPAELKKILKGKSNLFVRCLCEKVLTYALGRGLEYYDQCAVDKIAEEVIKNDYKFVSLILAVLKSDAFHKRAIERTGT